MKLIIHTDGGARGNPGPAAIGVVIEEVHRKTRLVKGFGKSIGETTNNVAEYSAVLEALRSINDQLVTMNKKGAKIEIQFFLDSTLVVNQLNGLFKVKDGKLRELLFSIRALEQEIGGGEVTYQYVPREKNTEADLLVNRALDQK